MKVTLETLKQYGACDKQVELFKNVFPAGAEVTLDNFVKADDAGLDVCWFARELASHYPVASAKLWFPEEAYKEYEKDMAPLRQALASNPDDAEARTAFNKAFDKADALLTKARFDGYVACVLEALKE